MKPRGETAIGALLCHPELGQQYSHVHQPVTASVTVLSCAAVIVVTQPHASQVAACVGTVRELPRLHPHQWAAPLQERVDAHSSLGCVMTSPAQGPCCS